MKIKAIHLLRGGLVVGCALAIRAQSQTSEYSQIVLSDGPVVYYQFEEDDGTADAVDSSDNGNTGVYDNVSLGNVSAMADLGYAAEFNGSNSFVAVPPLGSAISLGGNGNNQFTMECWINPQSTAGAAIYTYDGWDVGALHFLWDWTGSGIQFSLNGNVTSGSTVFDGNPPIPTGEWTYVVAVYCDNDVKSNVVVYINGQPVGTNVFTAAVPVDFEPSEIGAWSEGGRNFAGLIDEFAIYTNALSAVQVHDHYAAAWDSQPLPTLSISEFGNGITISWNKSDFVLQENTNLLNRSGWEDVSGATNSPINMPTGSSSIFYRLRSQ